MALQEMAGQKRTDGLWLAIIGLAVLFFLILPTLIVIPMSFSGAAYLEFPPKEWSLRWYREYFGSTEWMAATRTSIIAAILTTLIATPLGALAAYGLHCSSPRIRNAAQIMNRLLSVVRSRTDKSVELSRALLTSRLSMGNGCAEARLWRGREVLHACRNAGARIDAGSGQGSTWLRKAAMTGSATASLSRATGASVGRTSGRYGIGIVGSGRIVTAALALRSGTRSRAAFREGAFAATGPVHTVRRR